MTGPGAQPENVRPNGSRSDLLRNAPECKLEVAQRIVVFGAGQLFAKSLEPALKPIFSEVIAVDNSEEARTAVDRTGATSAAEDAYRRLSYAFTSAEASETIGYIATPHKLPAIISAIDAGLKFLVSEKPLAANMAELRTLSAVLKEHPQVRLYALDHYITKSFPLMLLTGSLLPADPRAAWVTKVDGNPVPSELPGTLSQLIGDIQTIEVRINEGGSFGLPDLDKRSFLWNDRHNGGMLLDLGMHALASLLAAGLLNPKQVQIVSANRFVLNQERNDFVAARQQDVEIKGVAQIDTTIESRKISISLYVAKTFEPEDSDQWRTTIVGTKGRATLYTRSGRSLKITLNDQPNPIVELKLSGAPYGRALEEAVLYFQGKLPQFDGYIAEASGAIKLIDEIKRVAKSTEEI